MRRGCGFDSKRCGWRYLSACHAIDHIVDHHNSDTYVSSSCMDEVAESDAADVAISAEDDNVEVRSHEFDASGHWYASSMSCMYGVSSEVG